ncbi:hypothetical protein CALCODRAFT_497736 [Calocera cornea HHB12733]|uniref:Uncharacterized protein n=1 Tax=Calocera cornea HHB12733 TaxID=1353952 RepID=A0A165F4G2_9BASI|nr:hypothetical protein CALCODRAFT_497736 [Calocera cornea HHB12733]
MKLDDLRARLNGNSRTEPSEKSTSKSDKTHEEERSLPRFSFKDLKDRGAAMSRSTVQDEAAETRVASETGASLLVEEAHKNDTRVPNNRISMNGQFHAAHTTYPPSQPYPDNESQGSDDESFMASRRIPLKRELSDRSTALRTSRVKSSTQTAEHGTSSRSSTPTRFGRADRSGAQRTLDEFEINHSTTHLNISKPLSAREINPAEDGQSSGRSSPGLSLHPSDLSEEEKAPRKSLLDLERLNWKQMQDREAELPRPAWSTSPEMAVPSPPTSNGLTPSLPDSATPAPRMTGHERQASAASELSVTLSFSSLLDGAEYAGEAGPSTSSPIKQRAKPSLQADEQRLRRLREANALRKSPSPVPSRKVEEKDTKPSSPDPSENMPVSSPPRPSSSRQRVFQVPATPPDLPALPTVSDESDGPQTFVNQAKAHLRAMPEEVSDSMMASLEGPLLRPSQRRASEDHEWEKVTPLNSIISLDSRITTTPSRQEQRSRMRSISKGIELPLKPSPAKIKNPPTAVPTSPHQDTSRQTQPDSPVQHISGLPSPTISDEVAEATASVEASGLPQTDTTKIISLPPENGDRSTADLARSPIESEATIRQVVARLPSPVSRDPSPAQSKVISREESIAAGAGLAKLESKLFSTTEGEMSSFIIVEKAALLRSLQKAERLQALLDAHEEREKSRQVDMMTQANTRRNAASVPLSTPAQLRRVSILKTVFLIVTILFVITWTFEYGRSQAQAAYRRRYRLPGPVIASRGAMYGSTPIERVLLYMEMRRPEMGYHPVEWISWTIEALDFFFNGPFY